MRCVWSWSPSNKVARRWFRSLMLIVLIRVREGAAMPALKEAATATKTNLQASPPVRPARRTSAMSSGTAASANSVTSASTPTTRPSLRSPGRRKKQ